ncbi:MAG: transcriptional regulator [Sphingobacteriaceae bacterium]|jgi:CheY-like chemotaxis protein|nr:transcriptional regulator [Sphingobacteriaceae bacterium]
MKPIKNLFIIDDDEIFVFLTLKIIQSTGRVENVQVFKDGEEGLEKLKSIQNEKEQWPEIVLLDLSMPIMDGWEFLEEYNALNPDMLNKVRLYLASSSISPHDIERSKRINTVSDFIIKPFEKERFIQMLDELSPN